MSSTVYNSLIENKFLVFEIIASYSSYNTPSSEIHASCSCQSLFYQNIGKMENSFPENKKRNDDGLKRRTYLRRPSGGAPKHFGA